MLNKKKWLASERQKEDLSGKMAWCVKCEKRTERGTCSAPPSMRDLEGYCARAYNRMQREK